MIPTTPLSLLTDYSVLSSHKPAYPISSPSIVFYQLCHYSFLVDYIPSPSSSFHFSTLVPSGIRSSSGHSRQAFFFLLLAPPTGPGDTTTTCERRVEEAVERAEGQQQGRIFLGGTGDCGRRVEEGGSWTKEGRGVNETGGLLLAGSGDLRPGRTNGGHCQVGESYAVRSFMFLQCNKLAVDSPEFRKPKWEYSRTEGAGRV